MGIVVLCIIVLCIFVLLYRCIVYFCIVYTDLFVVYASIDSDPGDLVSGVYFAGEQAARSCFCLA